VFLCCNLKHDCVILMVVIRFVLKQRRFLFCVYLLKTMICVVLHFVCICGFLKIGHEIVCRLCVVLQVVIICVGFRTAYVCEA